MLNILAQLLDIEGDIFDRALLRLLPVCEWRRSCHDSCSTALLLTLESFIFDLCAVCSVPVCAVHPSKELEKMSNRGARLFTAIYKQLWITLCVRVCVLSWNLISWNHTETTNRAKTNVTAEWTEVCKHDFEVLLDIALMRWVRFKLNTFSCSVFFSPQNPGCCASLWCLHLVVQHQQASLNTWDSDLLCKSMWWDEAGPAQPE